MKNKILIIAALLSPFASANNTELGTKTLYQQCKQETPVCKIILQSYILGLNTGITKASQNTAEKIFSDLGIQNPELIAMAASLSADTALGGIPSCQIEINYKNLRNLLITQLENGLEKQSSISQNILQAIINENTKRCKHTTA